MEVYLSAEIENRYFVTIQKNLSNSHKIYLFLCIFEEKFSIVINDLCI